MLDDRNEKEITGSLYWIDPDLEQSPLLTAEVDMYVVYRAVTSLGTEFLWPSRWPEKARS